MKALPDLKINKMQASILEANLDFLRISQDSRVLMLLMTWQHPVYVHIVLYSNLVIEFI